MSGRLDRTSVAAILFIALGAFLVANAAIAIAGAEWYQAIVLDVIERSVGTASSAYLEAMGGFTTRLMQVGWLLAFLEGVLNWGAAAAVLRRLSWGRILGLVAAAVGFFGAAYRLVAYALMSDWSAPLPAFAWLEPGLAVAISLANDALAAAGYAAILVLLGRWQPASKEGRVVVAN